MGALDAAYHALTRVRAAAASRLCLRPALKLAVLPRVALTLPAAAQSNVTNVAFVITGALFGERVRSCAAPAVAPASPVCRPAPGRPRRASRRACAHTRRAPSQLVSGAFDSAWKSNNRGVRPHNARHAPRSRTHHAPHTPLRLACARSRVARGSPPVPARSARAGGPARNGCALQRIPLGLRPKNALLSAALTSPLLRLPSAEAVRRPGGGRHRQGLSAPRWPTPLSEAARWNPTHARSFRARPAVATSRCRQDAAPAGRGCRAGAGHAGAGDIQVRVMRPPAPAASPPTPAASAPAAARAMRVSLRSSACMRSRRGRGSPGL